MNSEHVKLSLKWRRCALSLVVLEHGSLELTASVDTEETPVNHCGSSLYRTIGGGGGRFSCPEDLPFMS